MAKMNVINKLKEERKLKEEPLKKGSRVAGESPHAQKHTAWLIGIVVFVVLMIASIGYVLMTSEETLAGHAGGSGTLTEEQIQENLKKVEWNLFKNGQGLEDKKTCNADSECKANEQCLYQEEDLIQENEGTKTISGNYCVSKPDIGEAYASCKINDDCDGGICVNRDPNDDSLGKMCASTCVDNCPLNVNKYGQDLLCSKYEDSEDYIQICYGLSAAAPVAQFSYNPTSPAVQEPIQFDASQSFAAGGKIKSYTWDFGDGSPSETGITENHIYTIPKIYTVTLNVLGEDGQSGSVSKEITITTISGDVVNWLLESSGVSGAAYADCEVNSDCDSGYCVYRDTSRTELGKMCTVSCTSDCAKDVISVNGKKSGLTCLTTTGADSVSICILDNCPENGKVSSSSTKICMDNIFQLCSDENIGEKYGEYVCSDTNTDTNKWVKIEDTKKCATDWNYKVGNKHSGEITKCTTLDNKFQKTQTPWCATVAGVNSENEYVSGTGVQGYGRIDCPISEEGEFCNSAIDCKADLKCYSGVCSEKCKEDVVSSNKKSVCDNSGNFVECVGLTQVDLANGKTKLVESSVAKTLSTKAKNYCAPNFKTDRNGNVISSRPEWLTCDVTTQGTVVPAKSTAEFESYICESGIWVQKAPVVCGDSKKEGTETCDDGNTANGDGCSSTCAIETGYQVSEGKLVCASEYYLKDNKCLKLVCVDNDLTFNTPTNFNNNNYNPESFKTSSTATYGLETLKDTCVAGNKIDESFCNPKINLDHYTFDCPSGYECKIGANACTLITEDCNNHIKDGTETDEDCGGTCVKKCAPSQSCNANADCASGSCDTSKKCVAVCGNNKKEGSEQCDDGNEVNGDGCTSLCQLEANYVWVNNALSCVAGHNLVDGKCVVEIETVLSDFNGDGCVNNNDLTSWSSILQKNYNAKCPSDPSLINNALKNTDGDLDNDGCVNNNDLTILSSNLKDNYDAKCVSK